MVKEILDKDRENVDRLRPAYEEPDQTLTRAGAAAGAPGGEATVDGEFREVGSDR